MISGTISSTDKLQQTLSLAVVFSILFTSIFSLVVLTVNAESSARVQSIITVTVPQIKMIYDKRAYDMSTFVLANSQEMKKITIPDSDPPEDGSSPPIPLKIGSKVHFQFDNQQKPTKISAYIIDMEASPVELYVQRQIGPKKSDRLAY
ncbi:MAG TPA: hypothetical protein VJ729_12000 [Nitrososphaeraceae archaeon]|nr:hypothetical protein [Nitrososphaeraceae archaeon]